MGTVRSHGFPDSRKAAASALQFHRLVTAILDEAAASKLQLREYYRWVYEHKPKK